MTSSPPLTVAEYFAGIGLVQMGLIETGWKVVFANDFSTKKHQMYSGFFGDRQKTYFVSDIFDLDPDAIPPATLATCSFPCVDLSLAGKMHGINGNHSSAFWGFHDILKSQGSKSPPLIMLENVPGWLLSNKGSDFRITVQALNEIGYSCDVVMLNALSFTPQSRLRVFLFGRKDHDKDPTAISRILARSGSLMPKSLRSRVLDNTDLDWMYLPIPEPPALRKSGLKDEIIEHFPEESGVWWNREKTERHLSMMSEKHKERVQLLVKQDQVTYRTFYRRTRNGEQRVEVRSGDTAGCLRTAIGGSAKQFVIQLGNNRIRMRNMTAREYARLQGVPDNYTINAPEIQALTGFGDAVCVPVIGWIAENVLASLLSELQGDKFLHVAQTADAALAG